MRFECTIKIESEHGEKIAKSLQMDEKENVKYSYDSQQVTMHLEEDNKKHFKKAISSVVDRMLLADDTLELCQKYEEHEQE